MSIEFYVSRLGSFKFRLFNIYYFVSHKFNLLKILHFDYFYVNACKLQVFYTILRTTIMQLWFCKYFYDEFYICCTCDFIHKREKVNYVGLKLVDWKQNYYVKKSEYAAE